MYTDVVAIHSSGYFASNETTVMTTWSLKRMLSIKIK